jgi:hypothetical protein
MDSVVARVSMSIDIDSYILDGYIRRTVARALQMSSKIHLLFRQMRRRRLNVPFAGYFRNYSLDNLKYIKSKCRASTVTQKRTQTKLSACGNLVRRSVRSLFPLFWNSLRGQKAGLRIMDLLLFHLERLFEWINSTTSIIIRQRAQFPADRKRAPRSLVPSLAVCLAFVLCFRSDARD